ncbi:MAG TPA: hypothetical protein VH165_35125, partial [Kofleriaceae bacterium]|nr:hypothetical protein [Kofleriaceae bacterium]
MVTTIPGNVHLDQAIERAVNALSDLIGRGVLLRAVLINDLFGRLRVAVWPKHGKPDFKELVSAQLSEACKALWS